jgi:hypothetical protein
LGTSIFGASGELMHIMSLNSHSILPVPFQRLVWHIYLPDFKTDKRYKYNLLKQKSLHHMQNKGIPQPSRVCYCPQTIFSELTVKNIFTLAWMIFPEVTVLENL